MTPRVFAGAAIVAGLLTTGATAAVATPTGNGGESGPHYTLNLIGTSEKNPDMTGDNGHRIFVPLSGPTKISLQPGDFQVLDANATDREGAFQLPDPDIDGDGELDGSYTVYIRPLGGPGGSATLMTCAEVFNLLDTKIPRQFNASKTTDDAYCSLDTVGTEILTRTKGKSTFTDVTDELLTLRIIVELLDADGTPTGVVDEVDVPLFDEAFSGYFWELDNNGLRLAQLRFVYG